MVGKFIPWEEKCMYNFGIQSTNLNISVSCYGVVIDWVSKKQTLPAQLQSQTQTGSCCSSVKKMASPAPPGLLSADVFYDPSSSVRTLLVRLVAFSTLPLSSVSPSLPLSFETKKEFFLINTQQLFLYVSIL